VGLVHCRLLYRPRAKRLAGYLGIALAFFGVLCLAGNGALHQKKPSARHTPPIVTIQSKELVQNGQFSLIQGGCQNEEERGMRRGRQVVHATEKKGDLWAEAGAGFGVSVAAGQYCWVKGWSDAK
jgi:hypothetical protein